MAMMKTGLTPTQPQAPKPSTANQVLSGPQTINYAGTQSTDPYRSGLQTSFQGQYDPSNSSSFATYANDSDADVRQAQGLQNQLSQAVTGHDPGADQRALAAQLDAVRGRIGQKNALGESINSNSAMEGNAENSVRNSANQAMNSGIKNTRQNFNSRGLLYSGMRQGGESAVRAGVAGQMAQGLADTKRDYSNLKEQQKTAYSSVDFATAQRNLDLANQAFDTVTKNNVARAQAYQQLGEGVGRVAGTFASARNNTTPAAQRPTVAPNDYRFLGTGSSDGYGGQQMAATNNEYGTTG